MKRAILLVAFGTTAPEAQKVFDIIDAQTRAAFPDDDIRWAYTSRFVKAKLAKEGKTLDSPEIAMARLMNDGFTHVAVLPLLVMPGEEFHRLHNNVRLFERMTGGFRMVAVASPLLSIHSDLRRVAEAMRGRIPSERKPDEPVVFIGHGNARHPSDSLYAAMGFIMQEIDPNIHIGTVSGYPGMDDVLPRLSVASGKKAYLAPLMTTAGEHLRNDIAGDGPGSWKSALARIGWDCRTSFQGMGEHPEIVDVWLDHLRDALARLEGGGKRHGAA